MKMKFDFTKIDGSKRRMERWWEEGGWTGCEPSRVDTESLSEGAGRIL